MTNTTKTAALIKCHQGQCKYRSFYVILAEVSLATPKEVRALRSNCLRFSREQGQQQAQGAYFNLTQGLLVSLGLRTNDLNDTCHLLKPKSNRVSVEVIRFQCLDAYCHMSQDCHKLAISPSGWQFLDHHTHLATVLCLPLSSPTSGFRPQTHTALHLTGTIYSLPSLV